MSLKITPVFFMTEEEKAKTTLNTIAGLIPDHAELTPAAFLNDWEDVGALGDVAAETDVLLEVSENIRLVPIRLFLRLGELGLPLVLFGGEFRPGARRLEAAGFWRARGYKVFLPLTKEALSEQLACMAAKQRIEHTRALLVGSRFGSPYVVTSSTDLRVPLNNLGVHVEICKGERLLKVYGEIDEARISRQCDEWLEKAERVVEPGDLDLQNAARFYAAIKDLLDEHKASALAVNCIPLVDASRATPCMALMELNSEGIPAACEGDLTALMTMIFLERMANRPTFMGNVIYVNPDLNVIELNHCVLPTRMSGYDEPQKPYILRDYHGRGLGVTASFAVEVGEDVTVARFDSALRELVYVEGQLVGFGEDFCRSNLRVKIPDVKEFVRQIRGNHHILVYGHYGKRIVDLSMEFGIIPVSAGSTPY